MSTCRVHLVFDPTCTYCNSRASREANEATRRAAEKTLRATQQTQAAQERELRAQQKERNAVKAESRRQDSIEWSQQQRQKKQAKATATAAARKAQGGGLLPKEKFWIYGGLLLFWVISVITCVQDSRWVGLVFLLAVGGGVGYLIYKRKIKAKRTPPPTA